MKKIILLIALVSLVVIGCSGFYSIKKGDTGISVQPIYGTVSTNLNIPEK